MYETCRINKKWQFQYQGPAKLPSATEKVGKLSVKIHFDLHKWQMTTQLFSKDVNTATEFKRAFLSVVLSSNVLKVHQLKYHQSHSSCMEEKTEEQKAKASLGGKLMAEGWEPKSCHHTGQHSYWHNLLDDTKSGLKHETNNKIPSELRRARVPSLHLGPSCHLVFSLIVNVGIHAALSCIFYAFSSEIRAERCKMSSLDSLVVSMYI